MDHSSSALWMSWSNMAYKTPCLCVVLEQSLYCELVTNSFHCFKTMAAVKVSGFEQTSRENIRQENLRRRWRPRYTSLPVINEPPPIRNFFRSQWPWPLSFLPENDVVSFMYNAKYFHPIRRFYNLLFRACEVERDRTEISNMSPLQQQLHNKRHLLGRYLHVG